MDPKSFDQLLQGVRELRAVRRGELKPARRRKLDPADPETVRALLHLPQSRFARMLGVGVGTMRQWERRRRVPAATARILLRVAVKHPEAVLEAASF